MAASPQPDHSEGERDAGEGEEGEAARGDRGHVHQTPLSVIRGDAKRELGGALRIMVRDFVPPRNDDDGYAVPTQLP
ncbi:hypothetical protein GCM10007858_59470 [Bradyrhizobium liaoningense]|nr:hypothetical protein GCM10007858_59470 [Bradyrhizobium liaoningense]